MKTNTKIKYQVQSRYEYWSSAEGKTWTRWFNAHGGKFDDKESAEEEMKKSIQKSKEIDKATKLKHEFRIIEIE